MKERTINLNLLILDPYFPTRIDEKRNKASFVVYDFVNEWKKEHNIFVIRVVINFPKVINFFLSLFKIFRYSSKSKIFKMNNINGYILNVKKFPKMDINQDQYKKKFNEILDILNKEEFFPDLCIAHYLIPNFNFLVNFKKRFGYKTFITLHKTDLIHLNKISKLKKTFEKNKNLIDQYGSRNFTIQNELLKKHDLNSSVIFSGVNLCEYNKVDKFNKSNIKLIFYGRFTKNKNILNVMKVVSKFHNIKLDIFGEGPELSNYSRYLKNLRDPNIRIYPYLEHNDVCKKLILYDYFIMPSFKETFGLSYLESMSSGVVPVGTRGQGIDGIIKDNYNGFLINTDKSSIYSFLEKISHLESNIYNSLRENAIKTVSEFSIEKKSYKYLEILKKI